MGSSISVFLDANVLIYFLDETAELHAQTIQTLQQLVDNQSDLYTSHHVIEEVLFIIGKLTSVVGAMSIAVEKIAGLPNLSLVEPDTDIGFAARYVKLGEKAKFGINDALILQLIIDAGIDEFFSFDKTLVKEAKNYGISTTRAA